ncbi:MAG: hypothetical protein ACXW2Y_05310 [Acidimicrobiia bacterium]
MAAVRLWVRADLRRRWLSWVVLGALAGLVVGLAAAAAADRIVRMRDGRIETESEEAAAEVTARAF